MYVHTYIMYLRMYVGMYACMYDDTVFGILTSFLFRVSFAKFSPGSGWII